jgi:hypothetical protein
MVRVIIHIQFEGVTEADRNAIGWATGTDPSKIVFYPLTMRAKVQHPETPLRTPAAEEAYIGRIMHDLYRFTHRTIATAFLYTDAVGGQQVADIYYFSDGSKTHFYLQPGIEVYP